MARLLGKQSKHLAHRVPVGLRNLMVLQKSEHLSDLGLAGQQAGNLARQEPCGSQELVSTDLVDFQSQRQLLDGVSRRRPGPTLQSTHIGMIESRSLGELALGDPPHFTESLQSCTESCISSIKHPRPPKPATALPVAELPFRHDS